MSTSSPPPSTDVFPVGISVRNRYLPDNIAIATVYGLFVLFLALRVVVARWRPCAGQRMMAFVMMTLMALFRVAMFAILAVIARGQPYTLSYGVQPAPWQLVITADVLSMLAWAVFCAAVFALGYSWSGRIPCVYCMIQFSDAPTWWKSGALYLIPTLLTIMSAVSSPLRLMASHTMSTSETPTRPDYTSFVRATFVGRASAAAGLAFSICFVIVVPYTAYVRHLARARSRGQGIDHVAIAAMVRKSTLQQDTQTSDRTAWSFLTVLGLLLLWESLHRMMLIQSTLHPVDSNDWIRSQEALHVLVVFPEWLAVLAFLAVNERDLDKGKVRLWRPWEDTKYSGRFQHPLLVLHTQEVVASTTTSH